MMPRFHRCFMAAAFIAAAFAVPAQAQQTPGAGANYETRLESLEEQMRALNGQIEQLNFSVKRMELSMQHLQSDTDARLAKVESTPSPQQASVVVNPSAAVAPPPASSAPTPTVSSPSPAAVAAAESVDENPPPPTAPIKGSLGAIKMQDGKVTGAVINPQAPPLPDTPADYGLTPQEQYDRAFDLLRQTDYDEAGQAFKTFIDKNPKDKLVDDAKYWFGETLYVQDKFDASAVAFADAYQQDPNGNKAPESLLKLAMSLEKLGKTADACTTLDSLKGKYPKASVKVRQSADQERTNLKCSAQQATPASAPTPKKK